METEQNLNLNGLGPRLDAAAPGWKVLDGMSAGPVSELALAVPPGYVEAAGRALVEAGFVELPGPRGRPEELLRFEPEGLRWTSIRLTAASPTAARPPRRPGLTVALVGPDGAGKSTIGSALTRVAPIPSSVVYMGIWRPGRLGKAGPLTNFVQLPYRPFKLWAYYIYSLLLRRRGHLVLYDRYIYDAHIPPRPPLAALKRAYLRVIARLLPHPDLVLVLKARGETMYGRKGQKSPAQLDASMKRLLSALERLPQSRVIDADRPLPEVTAQAMGHVWEALQSRWIATAR